ncbi:MAG: hypothetical protein HYZ01_01460 [Ignavibacteriales bacterium]|nr:hypothetical protein [Ignavibacteriales bacterium]
MLKATVVVAQRFCSLLVCGYGREKNEFFVAAFAASFDSSQNRCVVAANVMRHWFAAEVQINNQEGVQPGADSTGGQVLMTKAA